MAIVIENNCCNCATESYPCKEEYCSLRHTRHYYCDKCKDDVSVLYIVNDMELCESCVLEELEKAE